MEAGAREGLTESCLDGVASTDDSRERWTRGLGADEAEMGLALAAGGSPFQQDDTFMWFRFHSPRGWRRLN